MIERAAPYFDLTNAVFFPVVEELLEKKIRVRFRVTGRSMAPFLQGGEVVTVVKSKKRDLAPGDLVMVKLQDTVMVHRLMKKKQTSSGWTYVTKGDGNNCYDVPVREENVLGKVCLIEKMIGMDRYAINMESWRWKRINRLFAVLSRVKSFSGRLLPLLPFKPGLTERACLVCWCHFSK